MTDRIFIEQINRLRIAFGASNFDVERNALIDKEVRHLSDKFMKETVDSFIQSRKSNNPPLPTDFRDAAKREEQRSHDYTREWQKLQFAPKEKMQDGLKAYLNYLGVSNVDEAIRKRAAEMNKGRFGKRFYEFDVNNEFKQWDTMN